MDWLAQYRDLAVAERIYRLAVAHSTKKVRHHHKTILVAVVKAGSMAKGATALGLSQPNVSKAISDLESVLKVRLLDRTSKGTEPTAYGGAAVRWGSIVFDELRSVVKEIELLADPTGGKNRLALQATRFARSRRFCQLPIVN